MRAITLAALATCVLLAGCGDMATVTMDDTEVAVENALSAIAIAGGPLVDSVHIYGLRIGGDLSWTLIAAGATTAYRVTADYGSNVRLRVDSIAVFITVCQEQFCVPARYTVRTVPESRVSIQRYTRNLIVIDTSVIAVADLFGTTKVSVINRLLDVTITQGSSTATIDSMRLFGVSIGSAAFPQIAAGDTTAYLACGTEALVSIDSIVGHDEYFGSRKRFTWTAVDTFTVSIDRFVTNDVVFGPSSGALLSALGTARVEDVE